MSKAKAQKRYKGSTQATQGTQGEQTKQVVQSTQHTTRERTPAGAASRATPQAVLAAKNRSSATQALVMAGMLAVGCWGLAFTFIFLTTTQNHVLIGGMIAVMALMWSFSFAMRVRKARR